MSPHMKGEGLQVFGFYLSVGIRTHPWMMSMDIPPECFFLERPSAPFSPRLVPYLHPTGVGREVGPRGLGVKGS